MRGAVEFQRWNSDPHYRINVTVTARAAPAIRLLAQIRSGVPGVHAVQYQRYSSNAAAVNVAVRDEAVLQRVASEAVALKLRLDIYPLG